MNGKKLLLVGLAVVFVMGSVFMVACGGDDSAAKKTMQDALTVVEADIAQMTAQFGTGAATGADIKTAVAAVGPHWQAVIDACAGVEGADAAKAGLVYTDIQTTVTGLSDTAGLAELAVLLPKLQALQAFMTELRDIVGGAPATTVAS